MNRDPRFEILDLLIAGDPVLRRWREADAVEEILMRPRPLVRYINTVACAKPPARQKRRYTRRWRERRERYLIETGRAERGVQSAC